jgi:hypothetical protein
MRALQDKPRRQPKEMEINGVIASPNEQNLKEWLMEMGINGGKYKHVQRIAKHFVKERLIHERADIGDTTTKRESERDGWNGQHWSTRLFLGMACL